MTKKKMKKTIIIGVLMFYILSSGLMLWAVEFYQEKQTDRNISSVLSGSYAESTASIFNDIEIDSKEKSDEVAKLFLHYYGRCISGVYKYPFSLALQDREGNIMYLSDNYLYWYWWGDGVYVSLDDYLTEEIIKDLKKIRTKYRNVLIDEMRLHYDGEKYIPVEVDFKGQGSYADYRKTVKFTDYKVNKVIENNPISATIHINELETAFYNRPYYNELRGMIDHRYNTIKDEIDEHFGKHYGSGYSGGEGYWVGNGDVALGDGYRLYFAFRYNPYLVTMFSDDYQTIIMLLAIIFAIAGIIFYIMCMKVITKSEKLDEARNTFISGASHELKTPLAVIQNQCECIMENIAPEKNEEYIKSIYDEALRMNGIVSSLLSYSRLTQMTAVKKERCNLSELLRQEVENYRKFAENAGVTIAENIDDDIYADCNPQLMKMAIDNYLSNAVKYSVGDKTVQVNLFRNNIYFVISVENPADEESVKVAHQAWDEFSRGDNARQRRGASVGMGLPICKKIFELHSFSGYCKYSEGKVSFVITGS